MLLYILLLLWQLPSQTLQENLHESLGYTDITKQCRNKSPGDIQWIQDWIKQMYLHSLSTTRLCVLDLCYFKAIAKAWVKANLPVRRYFMHMCTSIHRAEIAYKGREDSSSDSDCNQPLLQQPSSTITATEVNLPWPWWSHGHNNVRSINPAQNTNLNIIFKVQLILKIPLYKSWIHTNNWPYYSPVHDSNLKCV